MLEKKQIWAVFLFEFKIRLKAVETACNINNTFVPGTTNEHTMRCCFKKFCRGDESLEDEECSGRPLKVDSDQQKAKIEADHLKLHEKLPKNSVSTILWPFGIWRKLERWKKLGASWADQKFFFKLFLSVIFSYSA